LQRITMRQQVAGQLNPNDLSTFDSGIEMLLRGGDGQGALMLRAEKDKAQQLSLTRQDQDLARQDAAAKRQRDAAALLQQQEAQRIAQGAFVPGQQILGEDIMGQQVGEGMTAPSYDIQRVMPELMRTAAGRAELKNLIDAQELTRPKTVSIKEGETIYSVPTTPGGDYKPVMTAPKEVKAPAFGAEAERASKAKFGKPFADLTPAEAAEVDTDLEARGLSRSQATAPKIVLPAQESEFEKGLGGGQSKLVLEDKAAAQDAAEILRTNQVGRELLKAGAITGTGADFFIGLNNALAQAGIDFGYADAAANSQAYVAAMGANVGRLIKQFGAGTGLSDADREYAEKMAGGKIALTEAALRRILSINDRAANRVIDLHNRNVKNIKTNIPLTVEKPVFDKPKPSAAAQIPSQSPAPTAAAPAPASAPMYARNPQTNERVMSTDGGKTWNPVR
jgi:hypothetical protein